VLGILDERRTDQGAVFEYLNDWDGIDPKTGDKWKSTEVCRRTLVPLTLCINAHLELIDEW
jgi:hypothetical protein